MYPIFIEVTAGDNRKFAVNPWCISDMHYVKDSENYPNINTILVMNGQRDELRVKETIVAVFGLPDFVHHLNDARLWFGGEMGENDVVVFANGSEARYKEFSYNDSEVQ